MIPSLEAMIESDKVAVPLAERAVESKHYISDKHETDPHIWMDVALWNQVAATIAQAVSDYDPSRATYFQEEFGSLCPQTREP